MTFWAAHNHQITAINHFLSKKSAALFLDPGLGKTSITLATIKILSNTDEVRGVLLIAPLRVIYSVWPYEIRKWTNFNNISNIILHGKNRSKLWDEQKDIYLINPENIKWLHCELLMKLKSGKRCPFNSIVIDESTKFKNHNSKSFGYVCDMLPLFKYRYILTGTPTPKSLLDLWSQIYILDGGKSLGKNYYEYRRKYFEANDWNKYDWRLKDFAQEEIQEKINHLVLDMKADDYLETPEIINNDIRVQLTNKASKIYKKLEKEMFIELDESNVSGDNAAQISLKCHQVANGNVYEDIPLGLNEDDVKQFKKTRKTIHIHDCKLQALDELLGELNGKPLLIAYNFQHDLEALRKLLGSDLPYIGKGIDPVRSKELEDEWNSGKLKVLVGHPASMGHGLNFQESGNDICWYSLTWNLELYLQFIGRICRQGNKSKYVRIHRLFSEHTVDEVILSRLEEREGQQISLRESFRLYKAGLLHV